MAENTDNQQSAPRPEFRMQKMFIKDLSFENPNAPEVYITQQKSEPKVELNLNLKFRHIIRQVLAVESIRPDKPAITGLVGRHIRVPISQVGLPVCVAVGGILVWQNEGIGKICRDRFARKERCRQGQAQLVF